MNKFTFTAILLVILAYQTNLSHGKNNALVSYMKGQDVTKELWQGLMARAVVLRDYVEDNYKTEVNDASNFYPMKSNEPGLFFCF